MLRGAHAGGATPAPDEVEAGIDGVRVSLVDLDRPPAEITRLGALLSEEERLRAGRFKFARDRDRFIACRGLLRLLLGQATGQDPKTIQFRLGPFGKPSLGGDATGAMSFNVSHSDGYALIATAPTGEVGVDIERVRPIDDLPRLAETVFSPRELREFGETPVGLRLEAFFNGWTRKEAFIKATGEGLSRSLAGFDVTLAPGEPARLLRIAGEPQGLDRWSLGSLSPFSGYAGAICVEAQSGCATTKDGGALTLPANPSSGRGNPEGLPPHFTSVEATLQGCLGDTGEASDSTGRRLTIRAGKRHDGT